MSGGKGATALVPTPRDQMTETVPWGANTVVHFAVVTLTLLQTALGAPDPTVDAGVLSELDVGRHAGEAIGKLSAVSYRRCS